MPEATYPPVGRTDRILPYAGMGSYRSLAHVLAYVHLTGLACSTLKKMWYRRDARAGPYCWLNEICQWATNPTGASVLDSAQSSVLDRCVLDPSERVPRGRPRRIMEVGSVEQRVV